METHLTKITTDAIWSKAIREAGIEPAELLSTSSDPGRRTYGTDAYVYKIVLSDHETTDKLRTQDTRGEYEVLKICAGIPNIPIAIRWERIANFQILTINKIIGTKLGRLSTPTLILVIWRLSIILLRLARRGVSHNDIKNENVLIDSEGVVSLIDFDQASRTNFLSAMIRSFLGIQIGDIKVHGSLLTILKNSLKQRLSPKASTAIRKLVGKGVVTDNKLPRLATDASQNSKTLLKAWELAQTSDASAPGVHVAYYSFHFEGNRFPGERPWEDRWEVIRSITNYSGKRILELGCNMSLLSCFLIREENAAFALGVDIDDKILKVAQLVASALSVAPKFKQLDFDSAHEWEDELIEAKPDIVFALNVLNWVEDKDRLMNFLGRFEEVIFEGHESADIERARFKKVGFTNIRLIGLTERMRPLLHCQK